jgi:hypothetical protein
MADTTWLPDSINVAPDAPVIKVALCTMALCGQRCGRTVPRKYGPAIRAWRNVRQYTDQPTGGRP